MLGTAVEIARITTAQLPRWMKTFTRKRATPGKAYEISQYPCSRNMVIADLLLPIRCEAMPRVSSAVSAGTPSTSTPTKSPLTCTCSLRPGENIKSLTRGFARSIAVSNSSVPPSAAAGSREMYIEAVPGAATYASSRRNQTDSASTVTKLMSAS